IALLAQLPVLTPQTGQLLTLGIGRGRHVGGLHRDRPVAPSSRSPGRSARTRAIAPLVFAQIGPDQPSVAGIPAHRVGDSSASMAPPSQVKGCPPNRVNSTPRLASVLN